MTKGGRWPAAWLALAGAVALGCGERPSAPTGRPEVIWDHAAAAPVEAPPAPPLGQGRASPPAGDASLPLLAAVAPAPPAPREASGPATAAQPARRTYPWRRHITATVFWVGEAATTGSPSNAASAWDSHWMEHFGGLDDPDPRRRRNYFPVAFTPRENPFYVALPYNDFQRGRRRADAAAVIPWAGDRAWGPRESMCKNRWVRLAKDGRTAYAQWQDVGPFTTDDAAYVFGGEDSRPRNTHNRAAGIDVSPAVRDYLGLSGMDRLDWQFVEEADVPEGPWRRVVTRSPIRWGGSPQTP